VTTAGDDAARNFGLDGQALHEVRYARAAEFVDVVTKLWDSWEDEALVGTNMPASSPIPARSTRPTIEASSSRWRPR
jgi:alkanesulfonate monooxygenase SsuD/methylene tetrahydromethanopterin reductase-like flavin-dependent oxidoreductase (luciferase family)